LSKKHKTHQPAGLSTAELRGRVERARREGRFQQALELAKQLHKAEPTPAHRGLLKEVYLGRAGQLRTQGHTRDAATVLEAAARADEADSGWLERLAIELMKLGEGARAQALLERVPEEARSGQLQGALADAAFLAEKDGRSTLPPGLQADYDRIVHAFAQAEAGRDEEAREALQGVSLRSPFLEWKLLLRGLQAFYQNDDARALENWQRLDPERLPARLAAPFRQAVDPTFRAAQPPPTQAALQQQFDRLQGSTLLPQLRNLRTALATAERSTASAFRQAEALLPALRHEAPHLLPRLAACFYWAIVDSGPDDVLRFARVFGKPPDDPNFNRLRALHADHAGDAEQAHHHWHLYEQEIASNPAVWVGGRADLARGLIWQHMGEIADSAPTEDQFSQLEEALGPQASQLEQLREVLGGRAPRPVRLQPSAEECFRKSLELAPDLQDPHTSLIEHYLHAGQNDKAEEAARDLLQRFPDHLETLQELAKLRAAAGDHAESLALLQRALDHNPLARDLRDKVSAAHMSNARVHAEAGHFDPARGHYQAALEVVSPRGACSVLCRWAAAEFKAANPGRGEELLGQARGRTDAALEPVFQMLVECVRLKLPAKLKQRFDQEFNAGLAAAPTGADAAALVGCLLSYSTTGVNYRGLKTHTKKILIYAEKARKDRKVKFTEEQLITLGGGLLALDSIRNARTFMQDAARKFPKSPHFPYLEAMTYFARDPDPSAVRRVTALLEQAERLAQAAQPDERIQSMLSDIRGRLEALEALNPSSRRDIFGRLFDMFGGGGPFGFVDEDEGDEDDWPRPGRWR
jgi:tetratricopeptide (TPR) repeat protein